MSLTDTGPVMSLRALCFVRVGFVYGFFGVGFITLLLRVCDCYEGRLRMARQLSHNLGPGDSLHCGSAFTMGRYPASCDGKPAVRSRSDLCLVRVGLV